MINARDFYASAYASDGVWILSAGPNGQRETDPGSPAPQGDDIGGCLK